ncbi:hypothetical protein [Nocardioides sp.]|uniref:hypothetical protein n=1 Tax=Nocardioides sp. TaxID=35761 RepID=UPI001A32B2D1|nr:hypothetical protein [Nocardioides sp.]MBJ7358966.1 hypothetical protein [Nocardioides sp.]
MAAWRSPVLVLGAALVLWACSDAPPPSPTTEQAERVLDDLERPASASFDLGSFDFGKPIDGVASAEDGLLAGRSWDVYYVLDDGAVGAWGAGLDVFGSEDAARASAERLADYWVCAGPREPLEIDVDGYDVLDASTCRRPTEEGYYATLSAADGPVTANLTLAAQDPEVAATALRAVWESLSRSTRQAVDALD